MKLTTLNAAAYSGDEDCMTFSITFMKASPNVMRPATTVLALSLEYHLSFLSRNLVWISSMLSCKLLASAFLSAASFSLGGSFENKMSRTCSQLEPDTLSEELAWTSALVLDRSEDPLSRLKPLWVSLFPALELFQRFATDECWSSEWIIPFIECRVSVYWRFTDQLL